MAKVRFGVLGVAKIAVDKVIPAMRHAANCEIVAIASRDGERASKAARDLGLPRSYGSYQDLLADTAIDAVYNPLPNHLHVPWSIRALEAGKHMLCEKPIALTAVEARTLVEAGRAHPRLKLMEAFMYRHHPQWVAARRFVREGRIGELRAIHTAFSYFNRDLNNVRNRADIGGGGLMDVGCYAISISRFLCGREPLRVAATMDLDPEFGTDRVLSAMLDMGEVTSLFTCGTQLVPYQRVHAYGTAGRVEIEIPFNAPPDRPCRMWLETSQGLETIDFPVCDQYTIQGELFAKSILEDRPVPTPIEDALANMLVIDAVRQAAQNGTWQEVGPLA